MLENLIGGLVQRPPLERTQAEMADLLDETFTDPSAWNRPLVFREGGYTRTCAYYDNRFEVLLLNWAPGASSAIHDHGAEHCWLAVLQGRLHIDNYVRLDAGDDPGRALVVPTDSTTLDPGDLDLRSGRFDIHRVAADHAAAAVSLHVYARPLRSFMTYDEYTQRCTPARGTYDEVLSFFAQA